MTILIEIAKITLPAVLAIYGMYLVTRTALRKITAEIIPVTASDEKEMLLRIRLQAYERLCLFLERISPENLIPRISTPGMTAAELEQALLVEIRNEFNHNLSQQVYMSDHVWQAVKNVKNEVIRTVNKAFKEVDENKGKPALDVFKIWDAKSVNPIDDALARLKTEARVLYD